jgi:ribosome maturation factor RimP
VSASRGTHRPDPATSRLAGWIEPVVVAAGYDLEELVVTPAGRRSVVRVVVDRDEGVTLDDIAQVSRAVSDALDA